MYDCNERWVDVFITKAAYDPTTRPHATYNAGSASFSAVSSAGDAYTYDDVFGCTVQSIEIDPDGPGNRAYITLNDTPWLLPTWSTEYGAAAAKTSPYAGIKVGDLVRVGGVVNDGYTDYLTVVEVREFTEICNATNAQVQVSRSGGSTAGTDYLPLPTTSSTTTASPHVIALAQAGIAHIGIRVNASLNCTKLNEVLNQTTTEAIHRQAVVTAGSTNATLSTRQTAYTYIANPKKAYDTETIASEKYYYPLYIASNWTQNTTLEARLDHGVKQVKAIRLKGYSLVNKRQVGIHHAHEMTADDYVILRIKEIQGKVISNNQYCNGAFAVLQAGKTSDNLIGAAEYSRYEPDGLVTQPMECSNNTIRNLSIDITDRQGNPAHFGRLHLWFQLLVTHG